MVNRSGGAKAGDIAGSRRKDGYIRIGIDGSRYRSHRLAWFMTHGSWPANLLDHINHDPSDNRMANLRDATYSENNRNARSSNPLGKGVARNGRRFKAGIQSDGKKHYLGTFDTPDEAAAAYAAAASIRHAEFACTDQAEATFLENIRNSRSANPLGKGVYKNGRGFQAQIRHNGKKYYLGTFRTPEEAAAAYKAAADLYYGKFACTEQAEAGA